MLKYIGWANKTTLFLFTGASENIQGGPAGIFPDGGGGTNQTTKQYNQSI